MNAPPEATPTKTRLAFVLQDLSGGGAQRCASEVALAMRADVGIDFVLLYERVHYPFRDRAHVLSERTPDTLSRTDQVLDLFSMARRLWALRREIEASTWVSFMPIPSFLNLLTRRPGERVVVSSRTTESLDNRGRVGAAVKALIRVLYRHADAVVALSEAVRADLIENFGLEPARVVRIYNPVDAARMRREAELPVDPRFAPLFEHPVVLSVGRLNPEKGQCALVRAFREVRERVPDAKLLVLGQGAYEADLPRIARALGHRVFSVFEPGEPDGPAEDCDVVFAGFQDQPARYVARADVFAFPSVWEGLGMALLEAVAIGAVAVASDCRHGPREILAPDTDWRTQTETPEQAAHGILMPVPRVALIEADVPLDDAERHWADTLVRVLEDPALRAHYRARALERGQAFHADEILPQWEAVLFGDDVSRER